MKSVIPAILSLLLVAGCTTSSGSLSGESNNALLVAAGAAGESTTDDFDIVIEQVSSAMAMPTSRNDRTPVAPLDVKYAITVTNHTHDTTKVRFISLSKPEGPFVIETRVRSYKKEIAPGASVTLDFWATAHATDANMGAGTPAVVRAIITFQGPQGERHEAFMSRVNGTFGAAI